MSVGVGTTFGDRNMVSGVLHHCYGPCETYHDKSPETIQTETTIIKLKPVKLTLHNGHHSRPVS